MERGLEILKRRRRKLDAMQHLSIWVTPDQKASLLKIAQVENCSMTDLVRSALADVIKRRVP